MSPIQIIQGLFNVLIVILRFVGLVLSQIPGTKHVLKHLPWHNAEDFEKLSDDSWLNGRTTIDQLRDEYRNTPEYVEQTRRSKLSRAQRIIEDNRCITLLNFEQPVNVKITYTYRRHI